MHDDDRWVVFERFVQREAGQPFVKDLFLVRPDGSGERPLLAPPVTPDAAHHHADWSPDGTLVAFELMDNFGSDGSATSIYVVDLEGGTPQRIAACAAAPCLQYAYPAWSPDGRRMAMMRYSAYSDGSCCTSAVVVSDVRRRKTGGVTLQHERVVASFTEDDVDSTYDALYKPRWSPDGRRLAYAVEQAGLEDPYPYLGSRLAVVRADGRGSPTLITEISLDAHDPDWISGDRLVFGTNSFQTAQATNQPSNLWTVRPDGSRLRQVTTASTDGSFRLGAPRWIDDDSQILATIGRASNGTTLDHVSLALVSPRTGAVTDLGIYGSNARLQPQG